MYHTYYLVFLLSQSKDHLTKYKLKVLNATLQDINIRMNLFSDLAQLGHIRRIKY